MKTIGVFTYDPLTFIENRSIKTDLLYFDHLKYFMEGKEAIEKFCKAMPNGEKIFQMQTKEIEELEKAGLISEYTAEQFKSDFFKIKSDKAIENAIKKFELIRGFNDQETSFKKIFVDFLKRYNEVGQLEARTNAIILNSTCEDDFVPIIKGNYHDFQKDRFLKKSAIFSIIIKKFPKVTNDISIEALRELKDDKDAKLKLSRLKNWTLEFVNSNLTEKEINQKIDYLLQEYQNQLELHKIKYEIGIIETFVTVGLSILENIVKLNLGKASKVFFDIQKKEIHLLEAEEKLKGKEVAYIDHLSQKLRH